MGAFVMFLAKGKIVAIVDSTQAEAMAKQKNLYDTMYWCVPEKIEYADGGFHYAIER